jgi:hypothetical protein
MKAINLKKTLDTYCDIEAQKGILAAATQGLREAQKTGASLTETIMKHKVETAEGKIAAMEDSIEAVLSALSDAISEAEGKASVRGISPYIILDALSGIERSLNIPKKHLEGVKVHCDPNAQSFPRAYRRASHGHSPLSTQFDAEYTKGSWRITSITRTYCGTHEADLTLTDEAKAAIIRRFETYR